jgi:endonuclease YncB( thermonuclease family)
VRKVGVKPVVIHSGTDLKTVPVVDTKAKGPSYKVIGTDLDTVTIKVGEGQATVRLLGVDPALFEGESPRRFIKEFNRNLMLNEFIYLSSDPSVADKDEEGNMVRYLYRVPDGLFLNLEIIRQGYGVASSGYDYKNKELFGFYEGKARSDKKGVYGLTSIRK